MPASDTKPTPGASAPTSDSDRRWLDEFKSRKIAPAAPVAQIILAWDGANLICEAPASNGAARDKIEGILITDLPGELQAALIDQLTKLKARAKPVPAPATQYRDLTAERLAAAREAGQRRLAARRAEIDLIADPELRAYELEKFEKALKRAEDESKARAGEIWRGLARDHDVKLANRAIPTDRRPRKRVLVATANGVKEMSPRKMADDGTETKSKKTKKVDPNLVVKIDY